MSEAASTVVKPAATSITGVLSKRLGSLQDFQTRIAARIAQAQAQTQDSEALLSFQVQGYRLLLPLLEVNELLNMPVLTPLPLARRWVLGLAVVRSEIYTVFDLAHCLGALLETSHTSHDIQTVLSDPAKLSDPKLVLLSKAVDAQLAFVVDKVLGTLIAARDGLTAVEDNAAFTARFGQDNAYIKALWKNAAGEVHIELSVRELLKSQDFANIAY